VLGSDTLYREWGYVAMSRARDNTRLYLVDHRGNDHSNELHRHGHSPSHEACDPLLAAAAMLGRSRAEYSPATSRPPTRALRWPTSSSTPPLCDGAYTRRCRHASTGS
jgi:hypothetical protein